MGSGHIILYIAASVDGFIADEEGGVEWLDQFNEDAVNGDETGGYQAFFESIDCLVMGSKTYEQVLSFGEWPYGEKPTYVFTHRNLPEATDTISLYTGEVSALSHQLTEQYNRIWLVGGAHLAQAFLRDGQIDELQLSLVPVLLGSGIALFGTGGVQHDLELLDTTTHDTGLIELHYRLRTVFDEECA